MKKKTIFKGFKVLGVAILLLSSFMTMGVNDVPISAASQFTLDPTPTPRVEVSYDVASTANVSTGDAFALAMQNTSIKRIVLTQSITLSTTNRTAVAGVNLDRSLQIDGNGFKITHGTGDIFNLKSLTATNTFHLKNIQFEKTAGASASTLISGGSGTWDILLDGVKINTGLEYAHIISGAGNPSIFFRGDSEFLMHTDDFAEVMAMVVFEDNSKVVMDEPGAAGTNFWDSLGSGDAIVHFGEYSDVNIKGNSSWAIFLYFKEYYVHRNANVKLYKDSSTTGVITSDVYPSFIKIDSGAKFLLLNLAGPAYGDQAQKVEIISNPGADVQFIGNRAGAGGGVRFQNANSKLILDSPSYFNIENKNVANTAFTSSSTTNQALQLLITDIGAWAKGSAPVAPTSPFPINSQTLFAGNTNALTGTTAGISSLWNTSSYNRIAKSTRPTISTTDFSLGITRTNPIISTVTPSNATLTYSSSNTGIASVDASGVVTGVAPGTATITVTATNAESVSTSTTMTVTVTNTPPTLTVPGFTQLSMNSVFSALTGVSANDAEDGPITTIQVTGSVNTAVAGVYPLTYSVTDSNNNTTTAKRVVLVNDGTSTVGTNYILSASNFTKPIDEVNTADAAIKTDAQVKLYDKATGDVSAGTVNVTSIGGYNATEGTYDITFTVASEPTLTKTIQATVSATAQKTAAKAELDAKANELRAAIDALPGLSDSQKIAARTAITNALNTAKSNVDAANTISSITAAKDAGILAMTQLFDAQKAISDQVILNAKNSLDQKATDLKAAIDALPGLTAQQIIDAKQAIDAELATAKANVDAATILTGISSAQTSGEAAMTGVYNTYKAISDQAIADAKTAAIAELNQKAAAIRTAINNVAGATQAEKDASRAEIDAILTNGITGVNNATTFAGITAVKDPSLVEMDAVLTALEARVNDALKNSKDAAIATLDDKLAAAKAAVNALPNLSVAEKAAAIQELDDAYASAETAITAATTTSGITAALNTGTRAFDSIVANATLLNAKNLAVTTLEAKAAEVKAAIDALPGLTAQEKIDGKAAIDAELATGTTNIQAATTTTGAQAALNVSSAAMDQIFVDLEGTSIQALAAAKTNAIAELTQVAADAKTLIDALPNLSDSEKATAKAAVDADLATAIDAINNAVDLVDVATELNNGIFAIEAEVDSAQLLNLKNAAIAELNAKALEANNAIDALTNLSAAEKAAAKALISNELTAAITSVNSSTTAIEIEDYVIDAQETFDLEVQKAVLLNEQNRAKAELTAKASTLNTAIDALPGLTTEQRDTAKAAINAELASGILAIDAGTRVGEVLSALDTSKLAMDAIYNDVSAISAQILASAKSDAITALQQAANDARNAIDALTNLDIEQKNAAKAAITSDLNTAIAAVNAATTIEAVIAANDAGIIEINKNVTDAQLLDAQERSIAELEYRATQVKNAIDLLVGLSDEDKATAKLAVDAAKTAGITNVQAATTIANVTTAQTTADAAIDKVLSDLEARLAQELSDAKLAAITELTNKATQAATAIDALTNLSASEKQEAKDAITAALNNATTAVNSATTVAQVTTAKTAGIVAIDNVVNTAILDDAKLAAIAELQAKATEIKNAIDALPGLTTQQKLDGKAAIDAELSAGIVNINSASSLANVQTAVDDSVVVMDGILADLVVINNETLADDKAAALQELNNAAQTAKATIDALVNLSSEEKATAKAAVDAQLATASTAVQSATTPTGISDAKNIGLAAIQQQVVSAQLLDVKNGAIAELEQKATEAVDAINLLANLTADQKAAALQRIADQKAAAILAVQEATVTSRVIDARNNGIGTFTQTVISAQLDDAKNGAKTALEAKAQEVIAAINALPGLTAAEKTAGIALINAELANGLSAIEAGTTVPQVNAALTSSKEEMDNILFGLANTSNQVVTAARQAALDELDANAAIARATINALPNLTEAERDAAIAAVDSNLATAKQAVNSATTPTEIGVALNAGNAAIAADVVDAQVLDAKNASKATLEQKALDVKAAIDALPGLTAQEKIDGKALIDAELANGLAAIDAGTSVLEIRAATTTSIGVMDDIFATLSGNSTDVVNAAKAAAIAELNQNANDAKDIINALTNLTPAEKAAAIAAVDSNLATAIQAVNDAVTPIAVATALNAGNAAIASDVVDAQVLDAKAASKAALEQKALDVKAAIDALPGLTAQEKIDGKALIDAELLNGLAAIDAGTNVLDIRAAETTSAAAMDQVLSDLLDKSTKVVQDAKEAAVAELEQKAADAKSIIDALPNLTPEEKTAAKNAVDAALTDAIANVEDAETLDEIAEAIDNGNSAIDTIVADAELLNAKVAAVAELEQKAATAKSIIDALPNLTPEEKTAAKNAVDAALTDAIANVEDAETLDEVAEAIDNGNSAIDVIVADAELLDAKTAAIADLKAKATAVIAEINALPGLTPEQKQAGIDAINAELENGLAAIEAGTTVTEVNTALETSKTAMDGILENLVTISESAIQEAKTAAIADLTAKATEIKNAIDAMPGISDEQKTAAKAAIDAELARGIAAINDSTTIAEITEATNVAKAAMEAVLYAPVISAPIFTEVDINGVVDVLAGVAAHDLQDGDLTSKITVKGNVDTRIAGIYLVTYTVTDSDGNSSSATQVFLVNDGSFTVDNNLIITADDFNLYLDQVNATDEEYVKLANVRVFNVLTQEWITNPTISVDRSQVSNELGVYNVTFTYNPSIVVKATVVKRPGNELVNTGNDSTFIKAGIALTGLGISFVLVDRKRKAKQAK